MKSITYAVILLTLTTVTPSVRGQSTGGGAEKRLPAIVGEVERAGAQIQLVLTNPSDTRVFQGVANVSVGLSTDAAIRFTITLAPNETRRFPLTASRTSGQSSDQYSLTVYNQNGALVLSRIAPIKTTGGSERATGPKQASTSKKGSEELRVNARLTSGLASRDAEIPTSDQVGTLLLNFEIESATPIKDASFTLSAKDFQRRQPVTVQGRADIEFKLPEKLGERKLSYTLTAKAGQPLARGEVDLDQLTASDAVSVGALTFDRAGYKPGESARVVIELLGDAPRGYRLELTVKDGGGNLLLKDERRGSNTAGKSRQEFTLEIPREVKGPVIVAYQVFGGQTGAPFDSGVREIILNESQEDKSRAPKRLSP